LGKQGYESLDSGRVSQPIERVVQAVLDRLPAEQPDEFDPQIIEVPFDAAPSGGIQLVEWLVGHATWPNL
jgi:hypothetical protein